MRWHDLGTRAVGTWRRWSGRPAAIPRIIHQTWRDEQVPERYRRYQESWRALHPGWHYRLWTDEALRAFVAAEAPSFLPIYDGYAQPICRVDAARYLVLERLGGVYADLDVECLRPLDPLLAEGGFLIGREPDTHVAHAGAHKRGLATIPCPSVIASVPGHPVWREVRAALVEDHRRRDPLDATGPFLLGRVLARHRGPIRLVGPELFYPFDKEACWSGAAFDLERRLGRARGAYTIHYWDGTWFRRAQTADTTAAGPITVRTLAPGADVAATAAAYPLDAAVPEGDLPLVSCLMVTHDRAGLARQAIACFRAQTWPRRELVILDDGPSDELARHVEGLADPTIRHLRRPHVPGATLGDLRNAAVEAAAGDFVCQWDDDDLSDPLRIAAQMAALAETGAPAAFLERWTLWWPHRARAAISRRRIWEGSLLCEKAALPRYPAERRGEDTAVLTDLRRGQAVGLIDAPRLYLYACHGRNSFDGGHLERHWHSAELQASGADYELLRRALAERLPIEAYESALGVARPAAPLVRAAEVAPAKTGRPPEPPRSAPASRRSGASKRRADDGPTELARAAEKRGDWHEAERRWRESWSIERTTKAAVGLHRALRRIGRSNEASALIIQVGRDPMVSPELRIRIEARLLEKARDWPTLAALLGNHRALMETDAGVRRIYSRALFEMGNHAAVTSLSEAAPDGGTATEFALAVEGLMTGATSDTAWSLVERARRSAFRIVAPGPLACLLALLSGVAGPRAADALLDEIDTLPATGPRPLATRIEAQLLRRRIAAQRALEAGSPPPPTPAGGHRAMLDRILPPEGAPGPTALLAECFDLLDGLATRFPDLHGDPLNSAADALAVASRVARAIDAREPLSLVRLGDGEGMMLPWRSDLEPRRAADLAGVRNTWWGAAEPPADAWAKLGGELVEAIRGADIVGISDAVHLARTILGSVSEDGGREINSDARGRIGVLHQAAGRAAPPDGRPLLDPAQMLTSAHIHQALAWWELWEMVVGRAGTVDLVTCHPGLGDAVAARFGVAIGTVHLVPAERRFAARFGADRAQAHFPDAFEALRPALAATPPGRVVLVAAGVLGKIYCHWAKEAGGIGLDIGAAADHWLGHRTRTLSALGDFALTAGTGPAWRRLLGAPAAAAAAAAGQVPPLVLVLTPMKDAARHWPRYRALLERLDYPAERLSLGILEGDSEDGTHALVAAELPAFARRFRSARLFKHDFDFRSDRPRWAPEIQPRRRSVLARARNRLLSLALEDETWVLWLDADLVDYPPDLLRRLLATGKQVVVPHCISARTGGTFDLNTFKLAPDADTIDWSQHVHDGVLQPPPGLGRLYLDAFAGRPVVPVDGVGGTALLVDAELHRDGLIFPVAPYRMHLETEGLAMMATDMGAGCWGVPDLTIVHAPD